MWLIAGGVVLFGTGIKITSTVYGAFIVKRHAHIYKDSQACLKAFKDFADGMGCQRSDSGMWYASHEYTHNFFSASQPEKLQGTNWDTIEIAKDVPALDRAIIMWNCSKAGIDDVEIKITEVPALKSQRR